MVLGHTILRRGRLPVRRVDYANEFEFVSGIVDMIMAFWKLVALSPLVMLLLLSFLASSGHHHGLMALLRACISWRGVFFFSFGRH
jgi:hypothetical protein